MTDVTYSRMQSVLAYLGMVAVGFGVGVIWTAMQTMVAAPSPPPAWAVGLSGTYQQLTFVAAALVAACLTLALALEQRGQA